MALTNAAGTLVERYTYNAYGTLGIYDPAGTVRSSSTYANRYTYTGREYDADLNLYHFRARWYDPATGGFITRDPLGYVDGMSLYRGYFGVFGADPFGNLVVSDFLEPYPDVWELEQHHWFPRKYQGEIETLCSGVGFSIHAYTTRMRVASYLGEDGRRKASKVYSDHHWLENWRNQTWAIEVSQLLGQPGATCCSFLTGMIARIRTVYTELQLRETARGVPEWRSLYRDPLEFNVFPWTCDHLLVQGRGAFPRKGWQYGSTWHMLLRQKERACNGEERTPAWMRKPCREQVIHERVPEYVIPPQPGGHGIIEDPIVLYIASGVAGITRGGFVRLLWRPTMRPGLPVPKPPKVFPRPGTPPSWRPGRASDYFPPTTAG